MTQSPRARTSIPGECRIGRPSLAGCCLLAVLSGCAVGPNYRAPQVATPAAFTEVPDRAAGQQSRTTTRPVQITQWWSTFQDPELDSLIERAVKSNLDLRQAGSRVVQARARPSWSARRSTPT